jgi:DNA-binding transcriptional MerR regulator
MRTIGQAAKLSGVNIETIRYYEREKIVPEADRSTNGRRLYDDTAINQLRFVRRYRDLGFPIRNIRILLDLSCNSNRPCSDVRTIGERHLADVRSRLADLQQLEAALGNLVKECADAPSECPVLKQLFAD